MFFCRQMKAQSVGSLSRHELILPTLHPGWKLQCCNKHDTEPTQGQDILAWAWCHIDRSVQLLFSSESGQREPTPMQAQKMNITLLEALQRFLPVHAILCFHIVEILSLNFQLMKGEINLMPVRVGSHLVNQKNVDVSESFPNYYFFYLEILSIKLNKLFIILSKTSESSSLLQKTWSSTGRYCLIL